MSNIVEVPWGKGEMSVPLPDDWRVLGIVKPRELTPAPNDACGEALKTPFGTTSLSEKNLTGKRVVMVVDDHSRPTRVGEFIWDVLRELTSAGADDQDIEILIATGVHRPSQPEEVQWKLGREVMSRFRWRCHDAYNPEALRYAGTTARGTRVLMNKVLFEADLVVCLGSLEPHLLLGFGGGLKMIIPGCAGAETIGKNHLQGVDADNFDCVGLSGDRSAMRLDLEEGAGLLGREIFVVNAAMTHDAKPARFFCGDPVQAHRAGEEFVSDSARLNVPEQSDVVLTNSFPMDSDLRQSVKCLGNTLFACKPDGVMMGCVRSDGGVGEIPFAKKTLPYNVTRTLLKVIGKHRVLPLVEKVKKGQPVEEIFIGHFGLQMLRRNHLVIFSDSPKLPPDIGRKMGLAMSFTNLNEMVRWASGRAPRNASVWVFPYGGSTFVAPV